MGTGTIFMSVELRAGTCSEAVFSINNSTGWGVDTKETKFSGISSTTWTTYSWQFPIPSNGAMNFHIGYLPTGSAFTQAAGNLHMKNLHLYKATASSTISSQLTCSEDVTCSRTVTATGFTSTSDRRIKQDIQDASLDECATILASVDVKTYTRTDAPGQRIGFIAQDIQEHLPPEFANIIGMQYGEDEPLLALSYDRLVCVLWGACKALTARVEALEQSNTK